MPLRSTLRAAGDFLRSHPRLTGGALAGALGLAGLVAGLGLGAWEAVCRGDCPSTAQIFVWEPKQATKILSHDGQLLAELGGGERRTPVDIETLPEHVPQAFIAVEDKRFYEHDGFSLRGILRAAVVRLPGMRQILDRRAGGGSTITQQLARNMFEQIGFEVRLSRKLKELKVARELERVYTKDQILEAYINQVNYGRGHHGITSAARWMFGKPPQELTPPEAAMLAAVINRPEGYSPFDRPEQALRRRNLVLGLMAQQGYIPRDSLEAYRSTPLPDSPAGAELGKLAPYFVEWVRGTLDDRYGADLYEKGLRVFTTLDVDIQRAAEAAMQAGWARVEGMPGYRHAKYETVMAEGAGGKAESPYLQGMLVAMDPRTGEVRALVGGRDFEDSKFNRATQARRQPGSVFKPFVYTAALASGMPASTVVFDAPILLEQVGSEPWSPKNYDGEFHGPMTMREGLRLSINLVAVKVGLEVGIETVAQYAQRMGISTPIPRVPAMTIGAADVVPLDVVEAYTPLATAGIRTSPRSLLRVEDAQGRVLWETTPERTQVLDTLVAAVSRDMLQEVVDNGTGYPVRDPGQGNLPYTVPAGGKTGTTNDGTDVWFVGFTPDLIAGVWMGFDRPKKIIANAAGGVYAAPVWGAFMRSIYTAEDAFRPMPEPWDEPATLTRRLVDGQSGQLATDWCPRELVYEEIFIPGTEPSGVCELHGPGVLGRPLRIHPDSMGDTLRVRARRRF